MPDPFAVCEYTLRDTNVPKDLERFRLLQDAVASHSRRTREAITGCGIDRHLLGLRLLLRPLHGESAKLFEDNLFKQSSRWELSTSGLSAGLLFKGTGFGAVYDEGYGINCELFINIS